MVHRQLLRALLGATALAATGFASPAAAQRIDRIVAFGDSYVDDGNLFELLGIAPPLPYSTGRFSGGTNYVDTLSQILDAPVLNFGIGGALTNNQNTNSPFLPGFTFEYSSFLAGGGGVFPTVDGTFDENDLVVVSVGGNDARFYQQNGGTLAGASAAGTASAGFATTGLNALVAAGAPTISFLAGDTSLLPEIAGNASAQQIRTAYSTSFNTAIQSSLAGYAANGTIVHYLDGSLLLQQVSANLAGYGLTGLACPALPNTSCIVDRNQGFLFYFDQLHLTSAGFAIVARYVATQLQAPLTFQATSELALDTAQQFGRTLSSRAGLGGGMEQGVKFFLVGDTFSNEVDENDHSDAFDTDSVGATAGVSYGFGNGVAGLAVNYSRPKARFGHEASETRGTALQIGGFAGAGVGGGFVQGYAGYGRDDHDIDRRGVVEDMSASADGSHWIAGARAGYMLGRGNVRFGPVVALDYAKAKVDGYTEDGDPALTLNVGSVSAKSLIGSIGAELGGEVEAGGMALRPLFAIALEKELSDTDRTVRFAQTSAPGIVNSWEVGGRDKGAYGRLTGGFGAAILPGVDLDSRVALTFGRDAGEESSAHVGLRVGF